MTSGTAEGHVTGHLTFRYGGRLLAASLAGVREVTRAVGVETLPGAVAPVTAMVVLRGRTVPVVDLRTDAAAGPDTPGMGDLLVLVPPGRGVLALAVEQVVAVHPGPELVLDPGGLPAGLPGWVDAVVRPAGGGAPLLRADLLVLAGLRPAPGVSGATAFRAPGPVSSTAVAGVAARDDDRRRASPRPATARPATARRAAAFRPVET